MRSKIAPDVWAVVAKRRLAQERGQSRTLTVAREEAIVRLRSEQLEPWGWTLAAVQAAVLLSEDAAARFESSQDHRVVTLSFVVPAAEFSFELGGLLDAGIQPPPASGLAARWRYRIGQALNGALGLEPTSLVLRCPWGGRCFERALTTGRVDPYVERSVGPSQAAQVVSFRLSFPERSWGRTVMKWLERDNGPQRAVDALWERALPLMESDGDTPRLVRLIGRRVGDVVDLGSYARWGLDAGQSGVVLVRQGVRVASLTRLLEGSGLAIGPGWIECEALQLDVDHKRVVVDDAFDRLVAWLFDATTGRTAAVQMASGDPLTRENLARLRGSVDVFPYVWGHQIDRVPAMKRCDVLALWPRQLPSLHEAFPGLELVPWSLLRDAQQGTPVDLERLRVGSFVPVALPDPAPGADGRPVVEVIAYVHRARDASAGSCRITRYGRELAKFTTPDAVLPGVTLVARWLPDSAAGPDPVAVDRLHQIGVRARARAEQELEALLGAIDPVVPLDEVPLARWALMQLDGIRWGLHYVSRPEGIKLRARPSVFGRAVIGRTRTGEPRTLSDALGRLSEVGGIVLGEPQRRWHTLESQEARYETWVATASQREVLGRVFGTLALWTMPVVPEAKPKPWRGTKQPQLRLSAEQIESLVGRYSADPAAGEQLLGHVLMELTNPNPEPHADAVGLRRLPLLLRYDPRSVTPRRHVSLDQVLAESPRPQLIPAGVGTRALSVAALEVSPGIAALLVHGFDMRVAQPPSQAPSSSRASPNPLKVRDVAGASSVLVTSPIADRLGAGAIHLAEDRASGISLWAGGLRVGEFHLPSPLRELTGRVWLTKAGVEAGYQGVFSVVLDAAHRLVVRATAMSTLMHPRAPATAAVRRFLDRIAAAVEAGHDRANVGPLVMSGSSSHRVHSRVHAPRRLPPAGPARLYAAVRDAVDLSVPIDTAWLSWKVATVKHENAMPTRVELGRRNPWIAAGLDEQGPSSAADTAALLIVARIAEASGWPADAVADAMVRLLESRSGAPDGGPG